MHATGAAEVAQAAQAAGSAGTADAVVADAAGCFTAWSGGVAVDVAKSDVTPKESVWLARRSKVITETVQHGEINPVHIGERNMVAGSNTKCIGGIEVRDHGAWRPEGRCGSRAVARPSPRRWNRARSRLCTSASATWSVTRARNIKNEVWVRQVHYLPGDLPDYHEVKWIKVAPSTNKNTDKRLQSPNKLATKRDHPQKRHVMPWGGVRSDDQDMLRA